MAAKNKTAAASRTNSRSRSAKKAPAPTTSRRAEANRRNAQKSTGPRTQAGKERSRFNALKHGMTAESVLLPGEDAAEFAARRKLLLDDLGPRNSLEALLIDRVARLDWMTRRADRAIAARLAFTLRHDALDDASADRDRVIELSQLLLANITSMDSPNVRAQPGQELHAARLRATLEDSVSGCDWLLERTCTLGERLQHPDAWGNTDGYELVRLMGHFVVDLVTDRDVAFVWVASEFLLDDTLEKALAEERRQEELRPKEEDDEEFDEEELRLQAEEAALEAEDEALEPPRDFLKEIISKLRKQGGPRIKGLDERILRKLLPTDADDARRRLLLVIEHQTKRLEQVRAVRVRAQEADAAEAAARLAFEDSPEAENERRYMLARDRILNATINTFLKIRKASDDGMLDRSDFDLIPESTIAPAAPEAAEPPEPEAKSSDPPEPSTATKRTKTAESQSGSTIRNPYVPDTCDDAHALRNEATALPARVTPKAPKRVERMRDEG